MAQFLFVQWLDDFLAIKYFSFDWDNGNKIKSELKHGILRVETEEVFHDEQLVTLGKQVSPECSEDRYGVVGLSKIGKLLFICFTLRAGKIRVISARVANNKEKALYEK